jgi:two-component system, OmpR family, sensor histidine kinase TctE
VPRFRFAHYRGREIRIAEVRRALPQAPGAVVVQIAETLNYRQAMRRRLLVALAVGELALVGVAVL